jgi:4-amino-4-deoxy-L-arabinose transferase-like glycosyltransferase
MADESSVQSAVFNIELGRGKRVLQWLLVVLVAIALSLVYTAGQFRGLDRREAMDMAQLARNISQGKGFTTYVIRPLSLWQLKTYRDDHEQRFMEHPDLVNPPLYPLVLAGLFKLLPNSVFDFNPTKDQIYAPERWVMVPFNQLCLLGSLLLAYFWAKQIFDSRVAVTAGLLLLFSDTLWAYSISGLPTNLLMLLFLLAMYCLFRADQRLNPPAAAEGEQPAARQPLDGTPILLILASSVLMGLCFLTRYMSAFLLLPMIVYVARVLSGRRAGMWAVIYALVFLAVITPWLVRNYNLSKSVLGVAKYEYVGGEAMQREYHPEPSKFSLRTTVARFLTGTRKHLTGSLKNIGSGFFIFFFVVGVMYGFRRPDTARLRRVIVGGLLCAIIGMGFLAINGEMPESETNGWNLLVLFLPLVAVYGTAFFYLLLDRIPFRVRLTRAAAIGAFAALNVAPMLYTLLPPRLGPFPYPPYCAPYARLVSEWFKPDEVGTSDMPWETAWYGDRRTVWLPTTIDEFYEIHDFVAPHNTQFLFLTPYMLDRPFQSGIMKGEYKGWASVMRGQLPKAFPLQAATLLPPVADQIIFADKIRWKKEQTATETPKDTTSTESTPDATNAPPSQATPQPPSS